jgi:hypothetical protein
MKRNILIVLSCAFLTGCVTMSVPEEALTLKPESLQMRQMQTRRFETVDETKIITACASLLQDLGFNLDESEAKLGVLVGSKRRSAREAGQMATAIVLLFFGVSVPVDTDQLMRACVVTRPMGEDEKNVAVRVTFQRTVYNSKREIARRECLTDPKIYQTFFEKLSKAVFLEAHEL